MKPILSFLSLICLSIINFITLIFSCQAQVKPDNTLLENTILKFQGNTTIIQGGTQVGNNLFHSFQDFSINTGNIVYFNNSLEIQNIISRVTGKSVSRINGLIRNNGQSNLLIINPNGIIFGKDAHLDIGGSFLGTTADSIKFSNSIEFSASEHSSNLLTVSTPIGLVFRSNSGEIIVQNQVLMMPESLN